MASVLVSVSAPGADQMLYHLFRTSGSSFWATSLWVNMLDFRHIVLLVEDNQDDEDLTLRAIQDCGVPCQVDVVRHGGEVVGRILGPAGSIPALVILDYHLPGLSGVEVLRELRRDPSTRDLPIVMLSGLSSDEDLRDCLNEGANSCVQKPMDVNRYLDHVGQIVRYWLTVDRRPEPTGSIG